MRHRSFQCFNFNIVQCASVVPFSSITDVIPNQVLNHTWAGILVVQLICDYWNPTLFHLHRYPEIPLSFVSTMCFLFVPSFWDSPAVHILVFKYIRSVSFFVDKTCISLSLSIWAKWRIYKWIYKYYRKLSFLHVVAKHRIKYVAFTLIINKHEY